MSDDLIDHYTKSGLVSDDFTRGFAPCHDCGERFDPVDLFPLDEQNVTINVCEGCKKLRSELESM
jgi:hydrogenase maturation factor HypF (carbamoyltransferase family)